METLTVTSVIALFPETKSQQDSFVNSLVEQVLDGEENPLKIEAQMACMEQVIKKYRSDSRIKELLLKEAEKQGARSFDMYNAKFEVKEVGAKYNYNELGHPVYDAVCDAIERLTEEKKELESVMKSHRNAWVYTDMQTGEVCEVAPVVRSSTTQVVVTINK